MENPFTAFFAYLEKAWADLFGKPGETISEDVLTDIHLIGSGLSGVLAGIETLPGVSAEAFVKVQGYVTSIQAAATSLVTTVETNIAKPVTTQIVTDFAALKTELATFSLPEAVTSVINAVETLLPYIEAAVGILTAGTVAASETVAASQATGLSADEARLVLKGA